jgi:ribosomal protein L7/L12
MPRVAITGWETGFNKVECTKTLQSSCGLGLTDAKRITDAVLEGQTRMIEMSSEARATALVYRLKELRAIAHVDAAF